MPNVKIGVGLGTPDAASAQIETGQAWSFRTGGGGGVLYSGHGSPSLSIGGVGDFYLDLDAGTLYGPKVEGDWGSPISLGGGPGSVAFTDLTDVPASYTGEGSKIVSVKATEDGLEFTTASAGSFTPADLTDAGTDGITITGGTSAVNGSGTAISQHVADTTHNGYLSSTDWNTFNNKQTALTTGDLTDAGTDGIVITGGTGSVIGTGTSIAQDKADATHNGYLDKDDWSAFNAKSNVEAFTDLSDTPANYTGQSGLSTVVKGTEDGLEFARKIGPAIALTSTTDGDFALWDGTDGLHVRDDGIALDIDGTLAADSDTRIPSQKAVKTYVDANMGGTGAPDNAHYVTTQAESGLSAEFNLGGLSSGILKQTVTTGVATPAIAGEGTDYLGPSRIDDTAYNATSWNGVTDIAPSKNAVRDKFESLALGGSGAQVQIDSYITAQSATSWSKPSGANLVEIYCIGGGGSGAGGRSATTAASGGGGGGGAWAYFSDLASNLDTTLKITVGAGGAQTGQNANGVSGNPGNPSFVTNNAASVEYIRAQGGGKGDVASNASTGGNGGNSGTTDIVKGNGADTLQAWGRGLWGAGANTSSTTDGNSSVGSGGGGGAAGGGTVSTAGGGASKGGGGGGGGKTTGGSYGGSGGGASQDTTSVIGGAGINCLGLRILGGSGGNGGGNSTHDGGAGGSPGGGGGGGSQTSTSGRGGAGGDGAVVIITHF